MARLQLRSLAVIVVVTIAVCLALGFLWPAFRNPVAIFLACMVGVSAYGAPRDWWREPDLFVVLGALSAVGLLLFLVAPIA